jgi:hypothetical protein
MAARAQQAAMPVIRFLNGGSPNGYLPYAAGFRQGLKEASFVEGQNVAIEYRWAENQPDRLPAFAADLVPVDFCIWGAIALPAVSRFAWAQTYPTHPITMIVSVAPGGHADVIARVLAERMRGSLGQPIIIENVTGAVGSVGVGRIARAAPDAIRSI